LSGCLGSVVYRVRRGAFQTTRWLGCSVALAKIIPQPNPYTPPNACTSNERDTQAAFRGYGWRAYLGWATLIGVGIGGCIGTARFFVDDFYVWGSVRDLIVGTLVGLFVGVLWLLAAWSRDALRKGANHDYQK
jgi:hypothetical protein